VTKGDLAGCVLTVSLRVSLLFVYFGFYVDISYLGVLSLLVDSFCSYYWAGFDSAPFLSSGFSGSSFFLVVSMAIWRSKMVLISTAV
jgi:hypothetical protein